MMKEITDLYVKQLNEKCARVDAQGFLRFITHTEGWHDISILETLGEIGKTVNIKPYHERQVTYDESQFNSLIIEFFKKYFPSKVQEVSEILDGTNPYFIDENGKSHINFLQSEKGGKSSVGHSDHNSYLEFNVCKNGTIADLRTTAHEISHALSGHHKRLIDGIKQGASQKELDKLTKNKGFSRDCIGEIESHIIERLFNQFLLEKGILTEQDLKDYDNLQKLSILSETNLIREESDILMRLPHPITKESLQKLTSSLKKEGQTILLERIEKMHDDDKSSPYMFRYIVGRMVADQWMKEYLKTIYQEDKLKKFELYWDNTDKVGLNDACDHLLEIDANAVVEIYLLDCMEENFDDENEIE